MGSRSGFEADLELDELQNVIDRGSGAIAVTQRQANAQFNLGLIALLGGFSGGAALQQVVSESYAEVGTAQALSSATGAQKVFSNSTNGAITLAAGVYAIAGLYLINETGTTSHTVAVGFGGTAVLGYIGYSLQGISISGGATPATGGLTGAGLSAAAVVATPALAAAGDEVITFQGSMKVTTAGTFIPQITYSAAPGGSPTLLAGSYFFAQPLNSMLVGQWS